MVRKRTKLFAPAHVPYRPLEGDKGEGDDTPHDADKSEGDMIPPACADKREGDVTLKCNFCAPIETGFLSSEKRGHKALIFFVEFRKFPPELGAFY